MLRSQQAGLVRKQTFVLCLALTLTGASLQAQSTAPTANSAAGATPAYDVSSIKPSKPDAGHSGSMFNGAGIYEGTNITLKGLLQTAFDKRETEIATLPAWAEKEHFDVQAKSLETDDATLKALHTSDRQHMLIKVLEDRFHLKWHMEQRELPVYEMVVAKGGIKMSPAAVTTRGGGIRGGFGGELTGINCSMEILSRVLSDRLSRAVIDKTGLTDKYDFKLKFSTEDAPSNPDSDAPSIFTAIQEQLGLKLQPAKGMQEVLVVDSVSMPSAD